MSSRPGLYLHVPFCARICPYCDFAVTTGGASKTTAFVETLLKEIALREDGLTGFDSVYLGGGTPSLLPTEDLHRLIESFRRRGDLAPEVSIILEANPEDVDAARLAAWRTMGVRGLSLGVQSFHDARLRWLGRRHTGREARLAAEVALAAGFDWVSIDLIYGLPEQSADDWERELDTAIALGLPHLSCYQLTVQGGTAFGRRQEKGERLTASDRAQADLFRQTHRTLGEAGLEGYEVSNFARSQDHRSRHNQKYWNHTPYLGVGPSAHSFDGTRRWWNERALSDWSAAIDSGRPPRQGIEHLDQEALFLETLMLGLRTRGGVSLPGIRERFEIDLLEVHQSLIDRLQDEGLVELDTETARLRPTIEGLAIADSLALCFDQSSLTRCPSPTTATS